jgi:hypothetical protein
MQIDGGLADYDFNVLDRNQSGQLTYKRFNELLESNDVEIPMAETHHMTNIVGVTKELAKEPRKGTRVITNETFNTSKESTLLTDRQKE